MISIDNPYSFLEGEIAIYYANADGTPMRDPNTQEIMAPAAECPASLEITQASKPSAEKGFDWRKVNNNTHQNSYTANVSFPNASHHQDGIPISSILNNKADYIFVHRFHDEVNGNWTLRQLHYAHLDDQKNSGDPSSNTDSITLRAGHLEVFTENTSQAALPDLIPRMVATVEWEHNGNITPCFYYDPSTESWSETRLNSFIPTGETETVRYCYVGPDESDDTQAIIQYLGAGTTEQTPTGNTVARSGITFENINAITIGNHLTPHHHGLKVASGHTLQTKGCPEPIATHPSSSHWHHPILRFRFLNRIYMTIAHGTVAIPSITTAELDTVPPFDPPIWIAPSNTTNPETGYTGLVLLPWTGILDGTVQS